MHRILVDGFAGFVGEAACFAICHDEIQVWGGYD